MFNTIVLARSDKGGEIIMDNTDYGDEKAIDDEVRYLSSDESYFYMKRVRDEFKNGIFKEINLSMMVKVSPQVIALIVNATEKEIDAIGVFGDSIITSLLYQYLSIEKPELNKGDLTKVKSATLSNHNMSRFMREVTDFKVYKTTDQVYSDHKIGSIFEGLFYHLIKEDQRVGLLIVECLLYYTVSDGKIGGVDFTRNTDFESHALEMMRTNQNDDFEVHGRSFNIDDVTLPNKEGTDLMYANTFSKGTSTKDGATSIYWRRRQCWNTFKTYWVHGCKKCVRNIRTSCDIQATFGVMGNKYRFANSRAYIQYPDSEKSALQIESDQKWFRTNDKYVFDIKKFSVILLCNHLDFGVYLWYIVKCRYNYDTKW